MVGIDIYAESSFDLEAGHAWAFESGFFGLREELSAKPGTEDKTCGAGAYIPTHA
jgi:hypothetical protein